MPAASSTAAEQLRGFIAKFAAPNQRMIRAARAAMRAVLPWAHELVYDNYNFFVIGYAPTLRPSDAILSLASDANGIALCFLYGATLPDPKKLLRGSGNQVRSLRLASADDIDTPPIRALIAAAVKQSGDKVDTSAKGTLIIRSVSAKQRPRRKDL